MRDTNEKLKKALQSLHQLNASLIQIEESLALQNTRYQRLTKEINKLRDTLPQQQAGSDMHTNNNL